MNIRHLKIGTRLNLAFGLMMFVTVMVAALGIWRLGTLKAANQDIATTELSEAPWRNAGRLTSASTGCGRFLR